MPVLSTLAHDQGKIDEIIRMMIKQREKLSPPPEPYVSKSAKAMRERAKKKNDSESKEDKEDFVEVTIYYENDKDDSEAYTEKVRKYKNYAEPEDWTNFLKTGHSLMKKLGLEDDFKQQCKRWESLLDGKPKDLYQRTYDKCTAENDQRARNTPIIWSDEHMIGKALNDIGCMAFQGFYDPARTQKNYLRTCIHMGNQKPSTCIERVIEMNDHIEFYPVAVYTPQGPQRKATKLPEDELVDILYRSTQTQWQITMLANGRHPDEFESIEEAEIFYNGMHRAGTVMATVEKEAGGTSKKKKGKRKHSEQKSTEKKICPYCKENDLNYHHDPKKCWNNPDSKSYRKNGNKKQRTNGYKKPEKTFTADEMANFMNKCFANMRINDQPLNNRKVTPDDTDAFLTQMRETENSDVDSDNE